MRECGTTHASPHPEQLCAAVFRPSGGCSHTSLCVLCNLQAQWLSYRDHVCVSLKLQHRPNRRLYVGALLLWACSSSRQGGKGACPSAGTAPTAATAITASRGTRNRVRQQCTGQRSRRKAAGQHHCSAPGRHKAPRELLRQAGQSCTGGQAPGEPKGFPFSDACLRAAAAAHLGGAGRFSTALSGSSWSFRYSSCQWVTAAGLCSRNRSQWRG